MSHETFRKSLRWLALLGAALLSLQVHAAGGFTEGVNYQLIRPAPPVEVPPGKVKVTEFLWYDCQTCFVVEPAIERWRSEHADVVELERLPAVVGAHMVYYARVFFTARSLGVLDRVHMPIYTALHRHGRELDDEEQLAEFFGEYGIDRTRFYSVFRGSAVSLGVRNARSLSRRYELQGAPSFVINGKYRVDPTMVRNPGQLVEVVDYLVDRELQE